MPRQLPEEEVRRACAQVVDEVGADGLRDMGRCMNVLKEKIPRQDGFLQGQRDREGPVALGLPLAPALSQSAASARIRVPGRSRR